ncbi:MAG: ATP synthase F1 subunit gamma [Candidatus Komeilibacteria bacterium]
MSGISKAIKQRLRSVGNTRKITKAMELVAAVKMRKAITASLSSRLYAEHAWALLKNLGKEQNLDHPLLTQPKSNKILLVAIASNRGLCGSYNINVSRAVSQYLKTNPKQEIDMIVVGRKAENLARRLQTKIIASFIEFSDNPNTDEISGLSSLLINEFKQEKYKEVVLVYTDFISSIKYEPRVKTLLPLSAPINNNDKQSANPSPVLLFEPNEEMVLNEILPRLTEVQIYQAILEALASEHSARMMAMKNASDNATAMQEDLILYYNQARQAAITQAIAEISGGAQALQSN